MNTQSADGPSSHGAVELFEVRFASPMADADLARLARALEFSTGLGSRGSPPQDRVGPARLDYASGLFLVAETTPGRWALQARTWGHPGPEAVHRWNVEAAGAAHALDPTVAAPERRPELEPESALSRVEHASDKRLSAFRRRLVGLP